MPEESEIPSETSAPTAKCHACGLRRVVMIVVILLIVVLVVSGLDRKLFSLFSSAPEATPKIQPAPTKDEQQANQPYRLPRTNTPPP